MQSIQPLVTPLRDRLGVCQWFHYLAYEDVERAVGELRSLGVRHLRTGISWADFHRPRGQQWYDWQMEVLSEFELLVSVWHTPPSRAEGPSCAAPPRRLDDYADFVRQVIERYGHTFDTLELWNEPNNRYKWDFATYDPQWSKFGAMIRGAARVAREARMQTVLGGITPVDPSWLSLMEEHGALDDIDIVAIHAFPGMWWPDAPSWDWDHAWHGWQRKIARAAQAAGGRPVWVTETGLATWDLPARRLGRFEQQAARLREAAAAPCERTYWYSLIDLDPSRSAIEGFHVDENEYHMGLVDWPGRRKAAWYELEALLAGDVPKVASTGG